ncbi:MAG: tetratricopeptide repeat protein, partial [Rhodothermales bacterium]|nr:tetratricopeptide repeat protein [Rhodothermales bacterium]
GMGRSLEMLGQRLAAQSFYEDVREAREFDSDRAARRLAARLLEKPMSNIDRTLLEGQNAFDSGRYEESERLLGAVLEEAGLSSDQRAESLYRLARCHHVTGRLPEAVDGYRAAMVAGAVGQTRWPAWSAYYIGRIEEASGQDQAARSSYERALSYSGDYDYRNALEKNVRVALERLSQNRSR